jgi:hypothetical protein
MTTIIIVIAAIKSWKGYHSGIFILDWAVKQKYRSEQSNDVLKIYEEINHPDLIAVSTQIRKSGDTSYMVDNETLPD